VRGQPFGPTEWVVTMIERCGLASTVRSEGRPQTDTFISPQRGGIDQWRE